ncbi:SDR family oxidoreductase [Pseudoduganella ginsengisoli]|uniref:SDR family oxidoreductase n=1 Tax=Pseudoduganella ginsengisoli TaxID=1462440 RepID=A0A6L6PY42_9BURK|nr:SDR family oxidoreductase [Pseudoduganella ginsengisoli]MTW01622.1 SDR family oxidoreductase [Pseudoduganella ginsengisoli]
MNTHNDYSGHVVLVTGGTRGIGRAIALAFLQQGATVYVCGRKQPEQAIAHGGRTAQFIAADVRDAEQAAAMVDAIAQRHGRLDILVNNAGGSPHVPAADASPRLSASIIALNLTAPLLLAQSAHAHMREQGGVILFIGSVSALRPSPGTAAYGAAKAGIVNLVRSLAVEWAPKVRVAAVSPGLVLTDEALQHYGDEKGLKAIGATIPMGRLAQPEEVAAACLYLASPAAAYASGCNLVLDGGGERPAFLAAANPHSTT